jgi:multicomponent Na+:H+ antiporter subunit E
MTRLLRQSFLALPLALTWVFLSGRLTLDSLVIGYVLGLAVLLLVSTNEIEIRWNRQFGQVVALGGYLLILSRDIFLSSVDVTRRVLSPKLPLKMGIMAVSTQDEEKRADLAALSAHAITITPGQLVVDFEEDCTMYVHCLDVESTEADIDKEQARRLKLLRRILGQD